MHKPKLGVFLLAMMLILSWKTPRGLGPLSAFAKGKRMSPQDSPSDATQTSLAQRATQSRFLFGVMNDDGKHYADEWSRGVRATTFELQWKRYEPQPGVYDAAYINSMKQLLAQLKAQGWYVQLVPGYQYAPDWVFTQYPDMYFVNQYGDPFSPADASMRVINAPFNPQARSLIAGYVARIFQDMGAQFDSVRVGGGVLGELRYPPPEWNGHSNSYWAFDAHAQTPAESGIPGQVVGWKPGISENPGSVGRGQLIINPSFEEAHTYFPILGWSPDDQVKAQTEGLQGDRALKVTLDAPYRVHQFVRVRPSTTYDFGCRVRSADSAGRVRMFITQYDASTRPVAGAPLGKLETGATSWANLSGTLTTHANTQYVKVELDGDRPGQFFFDDLWLRRVGETNTHSRDMAVPLAFYDWYVQKLTDYQNWQIAEIRKHYGGQLDVMYAGKGLMSDHATDALTNDLRGDGWSEHISALYGATVFDQHVAGLSTTNKIALYITGIEDPPANEVNDASPYPCHWSGAHWIAHLARSRGLPVWGENSGKDTAASLRLSVQRMRENGFLGLMWGFESELYADPNPNGYAAIDDYASAIASLHDAFLPLIRRP
jgi:Beta-galactosidase